MTAPDRPRFHLAIPVHDLAAARRFYGDVLRCPEGRSAAEWVDFDLYGHQLVVHRVAAAAPGRPGAAGHTDVDGDAVPVPHFGLVLTVSQFHALAERLTSGGVDVVIPPHVRFEGEPGEQWTVFVRDPSGNALEFKAFADIAQLFAT